MLHTCVCGSVYMRASALYSRFTPRPWRERFDPRGVREKKKDTRGRESARADVYMTNRSVCVCVREITKGREKEDDAICVCVRICVCRGWRLSIGG